MPHNEPERDHPGGILAMFPWVETTRRGKKNSRERIQI